MPILRMVVRSTFALLLTASLLLPPNALAADPTDSPPDLRTIQKELRRLSLENRQNRREIQDLHGEVKALRSENAALRNQSTQVGQDTAQLQRRTDEQIKTTSEQVQALSKKVESGPSVGGFAQVLDRYLGDHRFVLAGGIFGDYFWDRQAGVQGAPGGVNTLNTFSTGAEIIPIYRINGWIGIEGMLDFNLASGGDVDVGLEEANVFMFLNDYIELNVGKFMLPFGDFMEEISAPWINPFVTNPLPYGNSMMVPTSGVGAAARGGFEWGKPGQDINYTVWIDNSPSFDTMVPSPVVGQMVNEVTGTTLATNGKGFGGRFRAYLLPVDANYGDLEVGASTYDGKWMNGLWFTSWGVDSVYRLGNFEFRGEYLETSRDMPAGMARDNRQGWYAQFRYQLAGLGPRLHLDPEIAKHLDRLELLARYSGLNQRAVVLDEVPAPGSFTGPTTFQPHAREIALGADYWVTPSVVWKLEYDRELPRSGGFYTTFGGMGSPASVSAGATYNDQSVLTQLAVWF